MDELQEALHKFEKAADALGQTASRVSESDEDSIRIALGQAKRVRRESNVVVRALARIRDNLHSQEADNKS
jgi:3-hydroxy-3-methylglutaryl CoA synthase